jgi:hypothetical protein
VSRPGFHDLPSSSLQHNLVRLQPPAAGARPKAEKKEAPKGLRAVVRFRSTEEAQRAIRQRNGTYLGNSQIKMRLLP